MNQRQLASVLFAVIGVQIAVARLSDLGLYLDPLVRPSLYEETAGAAARFSAILALAYLSVSVLVGVVLVVLRNALADRLFPSGTQPLNAPELQAVAFSALGCYFVIEGISRITGVALMRRFTEFDWGGGALVVFGVALFLGARGVARLWTVARAAGTGSDARERAV
jgi:hypothetical protein